MTKVEKNGVKMAVRDSNQLAAFLNNGWSVVEDSHAPESETPEPETPEEKQYSKSEIARMSTADLRALAPTVGIEVTEESTGAKLKEEIIAKLGL